MYIVFDILYYVATCFTDTASVFRSVHVQNITQHKILNEIISNWPEDAACGSATCSHII